MLELSIPQPGENAKSAKDMIFTILSDNSPLSLIALYNIIKKQYNISITYQAVRKAVELLHKERVLTKHGKQYEINLDWAMDLKIFFDKIVTKCKTGKSVHNFKIDLSKGEYTVYTLKTLLDTDNFWAEIMYYWMDNLKKGENNEVFVFAHYAWWSVINLGREIHMYNTLSKRKIPTKFLFVRKNSLNKWAADLYPKNIKVRLTSDKKSDETTDFMCLGDTIIQIKYPKDLLDKIRNYFNTYASIKEIGVDVLTQLAHEPHDIKFILFKNPTMAQSLKDKYAKIFRG